MILMYHKIYPDEKTMWWVTVDNFYRQMIEIKSKKVVYLDDYDLNNENNVVITFDGVYKNVLEFAVPILKEFNYPFEVFVTGDYIGQTNEFDRGEPTALFCDYKDLLKIVESGGRLQWHTNSHEDMSQMHEEDKIIYELSIPDNIKNLDKDGFSWFAYPNGAFSEEVFKKVQIYFRGAVSCHQGNNDKFKFNRVTVTNKKRFNKHKVSIIIPSYNYGCFLVEAIESALRQTYPVDDILISDDFSSDDTEFISLDYVSRYPELISYLRNDKNLGVVDNFNKSVNKTSSEYICILGADNRLTSNYIEKCISFLDADPKCAIAYTDYAFFGPRAKIKFDDFYPDYKGLKKGTFFLSNFPELSNETLPLLKDRNFIHGSSMFRREAFVDVGGYISEVGHAEDHNLFLRMIDKGWSAKKVTSTVLEYRQHSRCQANDKHVSYRQTQFYKKKTIQLAAIVHNYEKKYLYVLCGRIYLLKNRLSRVFKRMFKLSN